MKKSTLTAIAFSILALSLTGLSSFAQEADGSRDKMKELEQSKKQIDRQLQEHKRRIAKTDDAKEAMEARKAAEDIYRKVEESNEMLTEARDAANKAQADYEALIQKKLADDDTVKGAIEVIATSQETIAGLEFEKETLGLIFKSRFSPLKIAMEKNEDLMELKQAASGKEKDSEEAKAYAEAQKDFIANNKDAMKAQERIDELASEVKECMAKVETSKKAIEEARKALLGTEDEDLAEARKACDEAKAKAREAGNSEELKEAKQALQTAISEYNSKIDALLAKDEKAAKVLAESEEINVTLEAAKKDAAQAKKTEGAAKEKVKGEKKAKADKAKPEKEEKAKKADEEEDEN